MAESRVLSALKDKRAELSGYIQDLEARARKMKMRLAHLDATIAMYAADFDPRTIRPRVPRPLKGPFERGELAQLCLEELRQAKTPANGRGPGNPPDSLQRLPSHGCRLALLGLS
jgi:hypothetical protein